MTAPRLDIDLGKIEHNARTLVERLGERGISVTGVTKAALGCPEIAEVMLAGGVVGLADSRIANIERMRGAGLRGSMTLLRSPMISEVDEVVAFADVSLNSELEVISRLSSAAQARGRTHGVVLMVELGDLREGIMPGDLESVARETVRFRSISLRGIGANLACRNGVAPDDRNMTELSRLTRSVEASVGRRIAVVSGGNSASLDWALGETGTGRVNDLRLGEAILLGREALNRRAIQGLHTDAVTLTAEVIESKLKPSLPWGDRGENAFGEKPVWREPGSIAQSILAIGRQDTDPSGLTAPDGIELLGASSDHLIVDSGTQRLFAGSELTFQLDYRALLRAMTSPFVAKTLTRSSQRVPVAEDPSQRVARGAERGRHPGSAALRRRRDEGRLRADSRPR